MTRAGYAALKEELDHLKTTVRRQVSEAIAEARGHGDLKENSEYQAAKEQQALVEKRISIIESKLVDCRVVDVANLPRTGRVTFGVTVTLVDLDSDAEHVYQIVGEDEANIKQNKISYLTPIIQGIIGKHKGDCVVIEAPKGTVEYEIKDISYS